MLRRMARREPLSVAIITRDEERNIARCLRSVSWADERIVVDSRSTDRTLQVARREGARVLERDWTGYVDQKNHAVACASHEWVLSLDADEWLPEATSQALLATLRAPAADAYRLPRRTAFSGAFPRRVWSRDRPLRLFRRDRGRFVGGRVHESWRPDAGTRAARLDEPILHLGYRSIGEYVERLNRYTDLAALGLVERGKRPSAWRLGVDPPWTFFREYVLRAGALDGVRGLVVSAGSAFYVLVKLAKAWELRRPVDTQLLRETPATPEDPDPGVPRRPGHAS